MVMSQPLERDVHLVGSVRLPQEPDDPLSAPPDSATVFRTLTEALPNRLKRLPDGETGLRHYFTSWQDRVFLPSPWIMMEQTLDGKDVDMPPPDKRHKIVLAGTDYDKFALASYREFTKLKQADVVPPSTRFLVGVPPPVNTIMRFVKPEFRAEVEPLYESLLLQAIKAIQEFIPAGELAIQFDCPIELVLLEKVGGRFTPWFDATFSSLAERIARLASTVDTAVNMGFHLCYGDINHKHIVEPKDTANMVSLLNALIDRLPRSIDFVHMPVPADRTDTAYFHPLKNLRVGAKCDVYLGLVHAADLEGTRKRIDAASATVERFGVATECGWGRTPVQDIASIIDILRTVSSPVKTQMST